MKWDFCPNTEIAWISFFLKYDPHMGMYARLRKIFQAFHSYAYHVCDLNKLVSCYRLAIIIKDFRGFSRLYYVFGRISGRKISRISSTKVQINFLLRRIGNWCFLFTILLSHSPPYFPFLQCFHGGLSFSSIASSR